MEIEDEDPYGSKDFFDMLEITGAPENNHIGITASPQNRVAGLISKMKCICTNECSMVNKQGELEVTVQLENYYILVFTEPWRDDLQN